MPSPGPRPPTARVDVPVAIKGASFGFSILVIGILLSALTQVAGPAVSTAVAALTYVLAFFLAARTTGVATVPALHGAVAAVVAYSLTLPLMAIGASGVVSVVGNIIPKDVLAMVNAWREGNVAEAQRWHHKLFRCVATCSRWRRTRSRSRRRCS